MISQKDIQRLEAALSRYHETVPWQPGVIAAIIAGGWSWAGASGVRSRGGAKITPGTAVRVASVTKMCTAAAVLRLAEEGRVGLDDGIESLVAPELIGVLRAGGYRTADITVRHLLQHTSGLFDWGGDPRYDAEVFAHPERRWTRLDQVRWAVTHGSPLGAPGMRFHYSDTGYVLLGDVLARVTGLPLAAAYRGLLPFGELGLGSVHLESLEEAPAGGLPRASQYAACGSAACRAEHTHDALEIDPSSDLWGGGGLVATMPDMATFIRALFQGHVFRRPETLAAMIAAIGAAGASGQGMGIRRLDLGPGEWWGHPGWWGVIVGYQPAADMAIATVVTSRPDNPDDRFTVARELIQAAARM